ncbi:ABC transporter substrate-binding protein [Falsochrobactrum sp. TDYN1]|uniref:ABC transporter substrate-binding protein n=1 Tax=Falsochrobactrum tianjinense TaxID=2706015 RepID=A0A949PRM3_9HYPH|nr:ABC transporter substrate-binding protein [Falsochrobactrum sp. TDYN1]MBV2145105.1 ABC transporter substrate-binding protein [Falsochrobactrum sp. TDYN1]
MIDKSKLLFVTNRRRVLGGLAATAAFTVSAPAIIRARADTKPLVVVSYGGSYAGALQEVVAKPFTEASGVPVQFLNTPDLAKVKAQVASNNVEWDIFDASGPLIMAGSKNNYWEDIDTSIVKTSSIVGGVGKDRVPNYIYCGGIAWNTNDGKEKRPQTFAELWDVEAFPGRRAFRNRISETLEVALLADGVDPKDLYPLDVERGFKALDRIKPHVRKWFEQTPQMVTLIQSNEIDFIYAYPNRIRAAVQTGVPLAISFKQTVNAFNYMSVLKGSARKKQAMEYIDFALRPETQAKLAEKLSLAPVLTEANKLMSDEARKWLPDVESPLNAFIDDEYWGQNYDALDKRFKEWLLF